MKTVSLVLASLLGTLLASPHIGSPRTTGHRHAQAPGAAQSVLSYDSAVLYDTLDSGGRSSALADVNGDGKLDLLVADRCGANDSACSTGSNGQVAVLLGNGDGSFQSPVLYDSGAYEARFITVADVNNDGKPDVLVAHLCTGFDVCGDGALTVLIGNGDGTFKTAKVTDTGAAQSFSITVADFNGDGKLDAAVAERIVPNGVIESQVSVMLGNGDGTFKTAVLFGSGGVQSYSLAAADFNGDGKPDIAVTALGGTVGVLIGKGDGTFLDVVNTPSGGGFAYAVAVADVNHDGKLDLVAANQCAIANCTTGAIGVLLGNGNGTFQTPVSFSALGNNTDGIAIADLNGDGKPDVLVSNYCADEACDGDGFGSVDAFVGNGDGTFQPAVSFSSGNIETYAVTAADLNGDGLADIVLTSQYASGTVPDGTVSVLLAQNFSITADTLTPPSVVKGSPATATITVAPRNGFQHSINLSCEITGGGTPAPICSFSPAAIAGASGTSTLTVNTVGESGAVSGGRKIFYALWLPVLGLPLLALRFGSQHWRFILLGTVLLGLALFPACSAQNNGGGGGGGGGGGDCPLCTSVGNYVITVVGTDSTNSSIKDVIGTPLTLTVTSK